MFLYYLPNSAKPDAAAKLAYAFEGAPIQQSVANGPDQAGAGTILADFTLPGVLIGYYPERQIWKKIPGMEAWLGTLKDVPSQKGPEQFARTKKLRGELVALGDGNLWQIPTARAWTESDGSIRWYTALPQARKLDEAGKWTAGDVLAKYASVWDYASKWFDLRMGVTADAAGTLDLDFQGENEACVAALAVNYRLSDFEVSELDLLNSDVVGDVLDALIDYSTLMAWSKKKIAAADSPDSAG
jgi:hypothetical protein